LPSRIRHTNKKDHHLLLKGTNTATVRRAQAPHRRRIDAQQTSALQHATLLGSLALCCRLRHNLAQALAGVARDGCAVYGEGAVLVASPYAAALADGLSSLLAIEVGGI